MLSMIVKNSISVMNLGIRAHAALLVPAPDVCADVLKRDGERCAQCGVHVPGMMEIDHLRGHRVAKADDLACICPFCHALKHPLWAGARKRILPIFAPDLAQQDIHRLAWACVGHGEDEAAGIDLPGILADVRVRHERLKAILGCEDAQSLFEAAFAARDLLGEAAAEKVLLGIDQFLRFWPAELHWAPEDLPSAAGLSTWSVGGFRRVSHLAARNFRAAHQPDFQRLRSAGEAVLSGALDVRTTQE